MYERPPFAILKATNIRFQELPMPKGIPLTEEEQARRRHEIFHQVVNVFLKKGFHETSMREIAAAAGLGKSTLYDYFRTKDEILVYFFQDQLNDVTEEAQRIALQNSTADIRLRKIMEAYIESLQANKSLFMKLTLESQRLKMESQKQIQDRRHAYQDMIRALIDEGMREGVFRKVNSLLAARLLISGMAPVIYGSRLTGTPQEMLNETLDIFFKGIEAC
jgi:TetR/AcrR family transcriptional regulator, cholesterol catabolism regulator